MYAFIFAFAFNKEITTDKLVFIAAKCRGVSPSLLRVLIFAPALSRVFIISEFLL